MPPNTSDSSRSSVARTTVAAPPAQLDVPQVEQDILRLWEQNEVEQRSLREGAEAAVGRGQRPFVFFDGPPFATGLPHYGHILPGTIKDVIPRYWTMRGHPVERRFGWDCHGLPIESLVENQLGLRGAVDIENYGIDQFNAACRAGVLRYTEEWRETVRRMGRWVDFEHDYKTMDASFMETVWWMFKQLWERDYIYEGHRVQPVSPALGTPLSNFEVAQGPQERDPTTRKEGHKRRQDPSVTVRFRLEDEDAFLWAWTTTPWTLPSNLALAVHPELEYVKVRLRDTGELAYVEPSRLADYQERQRIGEADILERVKGADLVGRPYAPLFPYFSSYREHPDGRRWAFRVVGAEYVTVESGTGIVHQAPAFGEEDHEIGQRESLPMINPLDLNGIFDGRVVDFAGMFAKDADKPIVDKLKAEGKLVDQDTIVHPYPHCYRTDQPLLYMALSTWFMKVEPLREQLVANNEAIHWVPEHVGSGRFGNWLEAARDWNLARSRYWGTPLPIWRCDKDPSDMVCVGSIAELEQLAGLKPGSIRDLHREQIDGITFPSQKTPGGTMHRVREVFDCWFESGSMPYAQNHYPFDEAKRSYVEQHLPADFIAEGLDQTRGWFYTLHVLATALFGRPAFKNVVVNGLVLAEDGKKMSKRLKNYPDLGDVIDRYGADALRAYLINSAAVKAEPMRFSERGVRDTVRMVLLPPWNAYNFFATYARADGWSPGPADLEIRPAGNLDRWILSRTQAFVSDLRQAYDDYELFDVVPAFQRICDDLNNWYIRRGRRRYWRGRDTDDQQDKLDAYGTLFRVLVTLSHAMAPTVPFFSEWLYQRLMVDTGIAPEDCDSVHFRRFPEVDDDLRDELLERKVAAVRETVALGMAIREAERIPARRPLSSVTVASTDPFVREAVLELQEDVLGELNVKRVEISPDDTGLVSLSAKANFKALGKRLGKKMKPVAAAVAAMDDPSIARFLEQGRVEIEGETLAEGDILISRDPLPGRAAQASETMTVVLATEVDEALRNEGLAREIINRIQNLRKQVGLEVSQHVDLQLACGGALAETLADPDLATLIRGETLADGLQTRPEGRASSAPHGLEEEIDGERIHIGLWPK